MKTLAICAAVKDEAPYIGEWIEFHRLIGVSRFVLYDDESTDGTREVVAKHNRGDVVLYEHSEAWDTPKLNADFNCVGWHEATQARAFNHYRLNHCNDTFWCAFIDPDEYLFHAEINSLPVALEPFEDKVSVVTNWLVFGSNGHRQRPNGLLIENYTRRGTVGSPEPWGRHIKSIVRTGVEYKWGPHGSHCIVCGGGIPTTYEGNPIASSMMGEAKLSSLRLHHYYHKSKQEADMKLVKGYHNIPVGYPGRARLDAHDRNEVEDVSILRFLEQLKGAMA